MCVCVDTCNYRYRDIQIYSHINTIYMLQCTIGLYFSIYTSFYFYQSKTGFYMQSSFVQGKLQPNIINIPLVASSVGHVASHRSRLKPFFSFAPSRSKTAPHTCTHLTCQSFQAGCQGNTGKLHAS